MSITSAVNLIEMLRAYNLLTAAQLDKVAAAMHGRSPDPRAVARELVKHGWLTPFQVNRLLQGRGGELVLGPYVLLEPLGEGGMGCVYRARHQMMDRVVALKIIRRERLADRDAVERFHREIRVAAKLDHPHLVRAHDAAQVGDTHFLVMEYVEGIDIARLVQKTGPLPVAQACQYVRQAALGLQYAAEHGLVHRDIKPSNIQVTAAGTAIKILDMGLARPQLPDRNQADLTGAYTVVGTPDYIAPEQVANPRGVDVRADIYSLGCTFYFMLTGQPPFAHGSWEEKLVYHRNVEPAAVEQVRRDVPPVVGAILRKMMAKRPEDRYHSAAAVADALAPFCGATVLSPAVVAAMTHDGAAASLIGAPASRPESGWTLDVGGSTVHEPRTAKGSAVTRAPAVAPTATYPGGSTAQPLMEATMLEHAPTPAAAPPPRRGALLGWVLAALLLFLLGALTATGVVVGVVIWLREPPSKNKEANANDKANEQTKNPENPSGPRVFFDQDFRSTVGKRPLPEGWDGDALRVVKVNDEPCLEVSSVGDDVTKGFRVPRPAMFVTLPPLALDGDFYIEGTFIMERYSRVPPRTKGVHYLTIKLESHKSNVVVPVVIDQTGAINFGDDARNPSPSYMQGQPTKFLLTRTGHLLTVKLNDEVAGSKDLGDVAAFDTLRLGLTPPVDIGGAFNVSPGYCRLYRLRVGTPNADGSIPASNMPLPKK